MTTREKTSLFANVRHVPPRPLAERLFTLSFGVIQMPWLARGLWGGSSRDKRALLDRLGLAHDALPHLGAWKADIAFLTRLVDAIERLRPAQVVEIGCGATSLVIGRALQLNGGGHLISYDQHGDFVEKTSQWLASHGIASDIRVAPLVEMPSQWASVWYALPDVPERIDLLVIDGPHWALNPFVRGRAEVLFDRIPKGGMVMLDDASRPGERVVARRWQRAWPQFRFHRQRGGKGTLVGERLS